MIKKFLSKLFQRPALETKTSEAEYENANRWAGIEAERRAAMAQNTRLLDRTRPTLHPLVRATNPPPTVPQAQRALEKAQADLLEAQLRQSYGYEREL